MKSEFNVLLPREPLLWQKNKRLNGRRPVRQVVSIPKLTGMRMFLSSFYGNGGGSGMFLIEVRFVNMVKVTRLSLSFCLS